METPGVKCLSWVIQHIKRFFMFELELISQIQYIPESWTPPCMLDPPIIPAVKRLRAKVYQWMLWGLI